MNVVCEIYLSLIFSTELIRDVGNTQMNFVKFYNAITLVTAQYWMNIIRICYALT